MREDIRQEATKRPLAGRAGFTLIELLIVVVIIGILASIAIPKFASTKERAYISKMKSDLHNLATAQEAYSSDNQVYFGGALPNAGLAYNPSSGTTIIITEATAGGWGARASYTGTTKTCAIFVGNAAPVAPATSDGVLACDP